MCKKAFRGPVQIKNLLKYMKKMDISDIIATEGFQRISINNIIFWIGCSLGYSVERGEK